jgi:hypothetical protein
LVSRSFAALSALMLVVLAISSAYSSYTITNLNTSVLLYKNSTALVTETYNISVTNTSVSQYVNDRAALNLTLSEWQSIIGSKLGQHILNPKASVSGFKLFPGPINKGSNGQFADLVLSYEVPNVTVVNRTGPRILLYSFNPAVFNFEHAASGEVLPQNTSLSLILPSQSQIMSVYPVPDSPSLAFSNNYANVSKLSWYTGEPLSKFSLKFEVTESLQEEVQTFAVELYNGLGVFLYLIIAVIVLAFIVYLYFRTG